MKYLLMIYGNREKWESMPREAWPEAIARQEVIPPPALETLIDDVYEEPTWLLREQLSWLVAQPRSRSPHHR